MSADVDQTKDPIWTRLREFFPPVCLNCDYSLIGLPPGVVCPECGTPSDVSIISLSGYSSRSLATNRKSAVTQSVAIFSLLFVFLTFLYFWLHQRISPEVFVLILAMDLYQLFKRWFLMSDTEFPVRLRLGASGFQQRIGSGPVKLIPWQRDMRCKFRIRRNRSQKLTIRWKTFSFSFHVNSELANFEFDSDIEQAMELKTQISTWIRAAGGQIY